MRGTTLLRRTLIHYWRTNLAVLAGVAVAVAVFAGALMVGVSVRASLRDLALERLGRTDQVVLSPVFFRDALAGAFDDAAPLIVLEGFVTAQESGRRASRVQVYAVDDRFWRFHGRDAEPMSADEALVSEALASELAVGAGDSIVVRVETASAVPVESLHGRKEDISRSLRLTVRRALSRDQLGEFSLTPQQGAVHALFVPLGRMRQLLDQRDRANVLLIAEADADGTTQRLRTAVQLDDLGLRLRVLDEERGLSIDSRSTVMSDAQVSAAARAADRVGMDFLPTLTHLANTIRAGERQVPYSLVAAVDLARFGLLQGAPASTEPVPLKDAIVLNEWAARDLGAAPGDAVSIEYYVWETEGRLSTRTAEFHVAAIVPIAGRAADRDLVPEFPGITDSQRVADWDPPFPIDLRRVRPTDEEYWNRYKTTPKAFIAREMGEALWVSRHGKATVVRAVPRDGTVVKDASERYEQALRAELDPLGQGFTIIDVRAQNLAASAGATDFGEYFTYFSTFLVVSALLLASLFFKLGVDQRIQQVGVFEALGFDAAAIRRLFLGEAIVLSVVGGLAGMAGAVTYASLIMLGLRTWWVGAVGTTALRLEVDPLSLLAGAASVAIVALASSYWSLRSLSAFSTRSLIKGDRSTAERAWHGRSSRLLRLATPIVLGALALLTLVAAAAGTIGRELGFFGAGGLLLVAMLSGAGVWLRARRRRALGGHGAAAVWRLGLTSAAYRPGRSVLCIALIAFATFVIVSVESFKRGDVEAEAVQRQSGTGGYPLMLESLFPIVHDLNDPAGRDAVNLNDDTLRTVRFDRFRVRPGDDASCLNLYQPKNPRILAATTEFITSNRFAFHSSLAETPEERANPWLLLNRQFTDGTIPVIADANSMTYVLHMKLGDTLTLPGSADRPVRLRLVAALSDSIFQRELLMSESQFVRTFPEWEGYRFFLADVPAPEAGKVGALLESRLGDFGGDVASTSERLAGFHRVEYTYLSTFQVLGGLGLVLGTLGLGAVLLRNVLERRRELALLRAVGYRKSDFFAMVLAENVLLLAGGLITGVVCALLAVAPVFLDRGGSLSAATLAVLLAAVFSSGLLASLGATAAALRWPLVPSLRSE